MSRKPLSLRFVLTATLLGNTLEWYDLATFGFLVPLFSRIFFPENNPMLSLVITLTVLGFGTFFRPIGGILFGWIGDRYGRRIALLSSVLLMTIPVFIIGLLPTYLQIGAGAAIILSLMRFIQGISAGGEFPGALCFLVESAPVDQRAYYGSFAYFGVVLGILLGGLDYLFLGSHFTQEGFDKWGWRIIYFVGGILGVISFLMRRKLHETPVFQRIRENHETFKDPLKELFLNYKKPMVLLIGFEILEAVGFNLIVSFSVSYYYQVLGLPLQEAIRWSLAALAVLFFVVPLGGKWASRWDPKKLASLAACGLLVGSLPFFWMIQDSAFRLYGIILLSGVFGLYMASMPVLYAELFPAKVRFSGIGIAYNIAIAVFGGFSPLMGLALVRTTGWVIAPAFLIIAAAVISLAFLRTLVRK